MYPERYRGQQDLKGARYGNREMVEIMAHFSNLQDFIMTMVNRITIASKHLKHLYAAGLHGPFGATGNGHGNGVPQLRSIYRSAF